MAKTFFYKKKNGEIFAMEEREASLTGKFYELVGVSDGKKFDEIIKPSKVSINEIQTQMNEYIKEGVKVPKTLHTKLAKARIDFQKAHKKAFGEELEIAKQRKEVPKNTEWSSLEGDNIERPNWAK
jgi:hypothetical protein